MELTELHDLHLLALAARDLVVVQIAFVGLCLVGIYWLAFRDRKRAAAWLLAGFVVVFYASLVGYFVLGL